MAIPDYADPRAKRFYSLCFVGTRHGENGTSSSMSWNSRHEELKPTSVIIANMFSQACAYCGNNAMPIQPTSLGFDISGYCCVCKDAMDEIQWREDYSTLLNKQHAERKELEALAPKPSKKVLQSLMDIKHQARLKRLGESLPREDALEKEYGIVFQTPQSYFKTHHH